MDGRLAHAALGLQRTEIIAHVLLEAQRDVAALQRSTGLVSILSVDLPVWHASSTAFRGRKWSIASRCSLVSLTAHVYPCPIFVKAVGHKDFVVGCAGTGILVVTGLRLLTARLPALLSTLLSHLPTRAALTERLSGARSGGTGLGDLLAPFL